MQFVESLESELNAECCMSVLYCIVLDINELRHVNAKETTFKCSIIKIPKHPWQHPHCPTAQIPHVSHYHVTGRCRPASDLRKTGSQQTNLR